jgi:hypothetical protein
MRTIKLVFTIAIFCIITSCQKEEPVNQEVILLMKLYKESPYIIIARNEADGKYYYTVEDSYFSTARFSRLFDIEGNKVGYVSRGCFDHHIDEIYKRLTNKTILYRPSHNYEKLPPIDVHHIERR